MFNLQVGSVITKLRAKDLDDSANLVYTINPNACDAKTERGILLKSNDFNCTEVFELHPTTAVLTISQLLDREMVETVQMGLMVEDTASETGAQVAISKSSMTLGKRN
jgi:hypothetical protein